MGNKSIMQFNFELLNGTCARALENSRFFYKQTKKQKKQKKNKKKQKKTKKTKKTKKNKKKQKNQSKELKTKLIFNGR